MINRQITDYLPMATGELKGNLWLLFVYVFTIHKVNPAEVIFASSHNIFKKKLEGC